MEDLPVNVESGGYRVVRNQECRRDEQQRAPPGTADDRALQKGHTIIRNSMHEESLWGK